MNSYRACYLCGLVGATVIAIAGCDKTSRGTYPLAGMVKLDGQPLTDGTLALVPLREGRGVPPIAIVNGAFSCTPENGPAAGKYRVEICAYENTGRKVPDTDIPGKLVNESRQVIPARYNRNSELLLDIPADNADSLNFMLMRK
jgi:hypothetical protein